MSFDADRVIDRLRLKRRLAIWQVVAVLAVAAVVAVAYGKFADPQQEHHVARISIDGIIVDDPDVANALADIADDPYAAALVLAINSPGGTVVGGEALYNRLRAVAANKPVVAVMGDTATSAAYMAAIATDHVIARAGTVTGSIGVILQTADVTALLERVGIKPEAVKSNPLKAQPNPLEPFSPAARAATQEVVDDLHAMFVDLVAERRGMERGRVQEIADGRIFAGRRAQKLGLVDAVGAESLARDWLADERAIPRELPLIDIDYRPPERIWREALDGMIGKALFSERLRLDGLISLWHPAW